MRGPADATFVLDHILPGLTVQADQVGRPRWRRDATYRYRATTADCSMNKSSAYGSTPPAPIDASRRDDLEQDVRFVGFSGGRRHLDTSEENPRKSQGGLNEEHRRG